MRLLKNPQFAILLGAGFFNALGRGVFLATSVLFATFVLGLDATQVGAGLAVAGACSLILSYPIGVAADRFGPKRALLLVICGQVVSMAALAVSPHFFAYVASISLFVVGFGAQFPINQAIIGAIAEETAGVERSQVLALNRSLRNLGIALGSLVALPFLHGGSATVGRITLLVTALLFASSLPLLLRLPVPTSVQRGIKLPLRRVVAAAADWRFVLLALVTNSTSAVFFLLSVAIPLIVAGSEGISNSILTWILILNTAMVVLLQMPLGGKVTTVRRARIALLLCGTLLGLTCLLLGTSMKFGAGTVGIVLIVSATVILTLAEIAQAGASWEISYALAPEEQRTTYLALWGMSFTFYDMFAPVVLTSVVLPHAFTGFGGLGMVLFGLAALSAISVGPVARGRTSVLD